MVYKYKILGEILSIDAARHVLSIGNIGEEDYQLRQYDEPLHTTLEKLFENGAQVVIWISVDDNDAEIIYKAKELVTED